MTGRVGLVFFSLSCVQINLHIQSDKATCGERRSNGKRNPIGQECKGGRDWPRDEMGKFIAWTSPN